mmetsp:Transcript_14143/g.45114  ORF Transcript_14143/g.45114 Transcript_14143/m.45114 type:complete len:705 (-) Transcript_14143:1267-3381(-)
MAHVRGHLPVVVRVPGLELAVARGRHQQRLLRVPAHCGVVLGRPPPGALVGAHGAPPPVHRLRRGHLLDGDVGGGDDARLAGVLEGPVLPPPRHPAPREALPPHPHGAVHSHGHRPVVDHHARPTRAPVRGQLPRGEAALRGEEQGLGVAEHLGLVAAREEARGDGNRRLLGYQLVPVLGEVALVHRPRQLHQDVLELVHAPAHCGDRADGEALVRHVDGLGHLELLEVEVHARELLERRGQVPVVGLRRPPVEHLLHRGDELVHGRPMHGLLVVERVVFEVRHRIVAIGQVGDAQVGPLASLHRRRRRLRGDGHDLTKSRLGGGGGGGGGQGSTRGRHPRALALGRGGKSPAEPLERPLDVGDAIAAHARVPVGLLRLLPRRGRSRRGSRRHGELAVRLRGLSGGGGRSTSDLGGPTDVRAIRCHGHPVDLRRGLLRSVEHRDFFFGRGRGRGLCLVVGRLACPARFGQPGLHSGRVRALAIGLRAPAARGGEGRAARAIAPLGALGEVRAAVRGQHGVHRGEIREELRMSDREHRRLPLRHHRHLRDLIREQHVLPEKLAGVDSQLVARPPQQHCAAADDPELRLPMGRYDQLAALETLDLEAGGERLEVDAADAGECVNVQELSYSRVHVDGLDDLVERRRRDDDRGRGVGCDHGGGALWLACEEGSSSDGRARPEAGQELHRAAPRRRAPEGNLAGAHDE